MALDNMSPREYGLKTAALVAWKQSSGAES